MFSAIKKRVLLRRVAVFELPSEIVDDHESDLTHREKMVRSVVLLLALISGWWTFEGAYMLNARIGGDTMATTMSAAVLAIGVTSACVTAWWVLMTVIPRLSSRREIIAGCLLVGALQLWMLSVSSLNNIVAQSGKPSLISYMENQLADMKANVEITYRRIVAAKPYLIQMESEAKSWCARADRELTHGTLSGRAGPGAVYDTLLSVCEQATSRSETLSAVLNENEKRSSDIVAKLQSMDRLLFEHRISVFSREQEFISRSVEVDEWLRVSNADDMSSAFKFWQDAMVASVSSLGKQSGTFGDRQENNIESLRASLESSASVVAAFSASLADLPEYRASSPLRVSLVDAVWSSKVDHIPQIAAAIGIDLFQLFMVLTFLLARINLRDSTAKNNLENWLPTLPGTIPESLLNPITSSEDKNKKLYL